MTTISLEDAQARLAETVKRTEAGLWCWKTRPARGGRPVRRGYRRLSVSDARDRERLSQEAYDQIFGPFDRGEFNELTGQDWQDLMDGKRRSPYDPKSLALPPKGSDG